MQSAALTVPPPSVPPIANRRCRTCGKMKALDAFAHYANTNRHRTTCRACYDSHQEARRAVIPADARAGLHHNRYEALYRHQEGRCAICEQPEQVREPDRTLRALVVYAYRTDVRTVVRLLCYRCNHGMDGFASSPALLTRALGLLLTGQGTDGAATRTAAHVEGAA